MMRKNSYLLSLFLLLLCLIEVRAETSAWDTVRDKMTGISGYSLRCEYSGPEGDYFFSYIVQGAGERILTEVLEGSKRGVGTRVYYNQALDAENVTMQTRLFRLRRSLTARDIKGTPLYRPLFVHLLEEICAPEPREVTAGDSGGSIFLFGNRTELHEYLEVDHQGNPLTLRRMKNDKLVTSLTFHDLEWGERPIDWQD